MDAAETLSALKARLLATKAVFMTVPRKVLQDAAETIERLTKERDEALKQFAVDAAQAQNQIDAAAAQRVQIKDLQGRLWSVRESRDHARKQRDAALAENKKLNGVIGGLSAQSQDEIDRLTVTANNNAAAHAKACEDLAQARAEVERLKARLDIIPVATGAPRCKLCGVLISTDPAKTVTGRHNQFCSTCCAR